MNGPARQPVATDDNLIQPFQVEGANLRGRLVRLGSVVDTILTRHDYPEPVSGLLAEAVALTAALAGALKFDGVFTLQTKGNGPIATMVADYRTPGDLRAYAGFDAAALATSAAAPGQPANPVPRLLGTGYLAFTVDQGEDAERYQGIVELTGGTLADCAHKYFHQSEQLEAGIRLTARRVADESGVPRWRASALMLQRLPLEGISEAKLDYMEDAWRRALMLMGTAADQELVDPALTANDLLYRLFHEDGVRVYRPQPLQAGCRCSRGKVESVLRSFPAAEMTEMVVEGKIVVTCEFCNTVYQFAPDEVIAERD